MRTFFSAGTIDAIKGGAQQNIIRQGVTVGVGWILLQTLGQKFTENLTVESTSWERAKARTSVNVLELAIYLGITYLIYGRVE